MDLQTLRELQDMPLHQKVAHTLDKVSAFIYALKEQGREPYISFSGGKDSTVLLDIIRRFIDPSHKISVVFCNTGNEFPEIIRFVRSTPSVKIIRPDIIVPKVLEKYGFPLISKEQAHGIRQVKTTKSERLRSIRLHGTNPAKGHTSGKISECWKFLIDAPFMVSEKCCDCLKKRPFAKYEKETSEVPIIGTMAAESTLRMQQYIRRGGCNSFDKNNLGSYPLSIWTDNDIWEYIQTYKIPYCELYDMGAIRTGCMFCGFGAHLEKHSRFELLFDLHPRAYHKFMDYTNNGITYREALRTIGVALPDECRQLKLFV